MTKGTVIYIDHSASKQTVELKQAEYAKQIDYSDVLERICEKLDRLYEKELNVEVRNEIAPQIEVKSTVPDIHIAPCETEINYRMLFYIALVPSFVLLCDILIRTFQ